MNNKSVFPSLVLHFLTGPDERGFVLVQIYRKLLVHREWNIGPNIFRKIHLAFRQTYFLLSAKVKNLGIYVVFWVTFESIPSKSRDQFKIFFNKKTDSVYGLGILKVLFGTFIHSRVNQ